jgi:hypothetical protein
MPSFLVRASLGLGLVVCILSTPERLLAQQADTPTFPTAAAQWVNSPPLSLEQLKGKGVFLWFFDEQTPGPMKWPTLIEWSKKYADEPIVFIGVNSGTKKSEVQAYVQRNGVPWPVIVDTSRAFEIASNVGQIRDQNPHQSAIITVDGRLQRARWEDPEGEIKKALVGAQWKVSPKGMPPTLRAAWSAVEFGNYAPAAPAIVRALKSSKPELKGAAEQLMAVVQPLLDAQLEEIKAAEEAGDQWKAYRGYATLQEQFKGYDVPVDAAKAMKGLSNAPAVKNELAAAKLYDAALKGEEGPPTPLSKRAQSILKKLVKEMPETEAGKKAETLLSDSEK